tara:strand:- start:394 stop:582 length:189 start_codon:yes stop_codon:yes gene_type:complete
MTKKISRYDVLVEQLQSINNQLDRLDFDITLSGATVNRHLKKIMKSRQSYLLQQIKLEKHNL